MATDRSAAAAPPTALVVEDDPALLAFTSLVLRQEGFEVWKAASGTEAWKLIGLVETVSAAPHGRLPEAPSQPHLGLVVLDLALPGIDGWEILRRMRERPALAAVPVIVLTASAAKAEADRAYELGANAYVVKPVAARALAATVHRIMAGSSNGL